MKVAFIGGGNMASAMIGGLLSQRWSKGALRVVELAAPARARLEREFGVKTFPGLTAAAARADCIVLAVKPQQLRAVASELRPLLASQLVISIAAGVRLADLKRWLGGHRKLVRVMPNTPALVRAGVSALYAPPGVTAAARAHAERILGAVGTTLWVKRENELDAVTAISGSGPAYVFYFIEALEQAAGELGLTSAVARTLALQTFAGAARLALASTDPVSVLRERVTSKRGTTERALESMARSRVRQAIVRAARAAAERSRELGDELGKD